MPNRLQHEKSPYLLQHAHNPVDWFPWGDEAFEKALTEDKPIFLSVGYSTCYWCHVMEREVFENPEIAQRLNEKFVSIKVDREERPDVDRIYMTALQSMSGSGGWPMSMFLTPDRNPFFGATYIPPVERYGRAGFSEVIDRLHDAWKTRRSEVEVAGERLREHLAGMQQQFGGSAVPAAAVLEKGHAAFVDLYDAERGGFGGAPKFPRPVVFSFLLRYAHRRGDAEARGMVLQTLDRMHAGGMYDHVGGGFHRYSTDAEWHVPHFEKMLYDQAQLVGACLEAYLVTGSREYAAIARDILQYVERDLLLPEGAFASAEDAESVVGGTEKKKEGAYYVWSYEEINAVLGDEEASVFCAAYDVREGGNVVHDPHQEFTGLNILRRLATLDDVARGVGATEAEVGSILHRSLEKLRTHRSNRPRPYRDDKVIASWNGMMISAFAKAASILDDPAYLAIAEKAGGFVMGRMTGSDGRLSRRYRDGEVKYEAGLEDYACVAQAALDLYEATFREEYMERAAALVRTAVELFSDTEGGGFFDTVSTDGSLIARMKESYDGAEPSGNAVMACVLMRLSALLHDDVYRAQAEGLLKGFSAVLEQAPQAAPQLLVALDAFHGPSMQIVLQGGIESPSMREMLSVLRTRFLPRAVTMHADGLSDSSSTPVFAEFLRSLPEAGDDPVVFVCENFVCRLPARSAEDLRTMLA